MSLVKKLGFTDRQKEEYRRLKITVLTIGVSALLAGAILELIGLRSASSILVSVTLIFLCIDVYGKYRKILSSSKSTAEYAKFQKEVYAKVSKWFSVFLMPYSILVVYLVVFQTELLSRSPLLVFLLVFVPGLAFAIWAMLYELRRFGSMKRAP